MTETDNRLVRLAASDNVLLLATSIAAGETIRVDGRKVRLETGLTLGHKIAGRDIAAGETILKYGFPIGVATAGIRLGAHVHIHNVKSGYTASYVVPEDV